MKNSVNRPEPHQNVRGSWFATFHAAWGLGWAAERRASDRGGLLSREKLHRFEAECQAIGSLSWHPHVVTVFDVIEEGDSIWLVMELVDSPSLSKLVADQGPMAPSRVAKVGLDVLSALTAAHEVGVVHRDVKPANVMVLPNDRAKLADFGVAKIRDDTQVTAAGLVIGSPAYMAPEQARAERAGPAADLWALGATLYFGVEGLSPFPGNNAIAVATAVIEGEATRRANAADLKQPQRRSPCPSWHPGLPAEPAANRHEPHYPFPREVRQP